MLSFDIRRIYSCGKMMADRYSLKTQVMYTFVCLVLLPGAEQRRLEAGPWRGGARRAAGARAGESKYFLM